ncbi:hypothetical protein [Zooshikella harenae]|uniref:Amino acid transport protein n=1 Tax=Zooshikella harenae TaxID=2827238 RepID=A0ABS5ZCG0_9GAMM|nr:hypothetical protein [Zooshikella harenae]MBU2711744.1 hypothetical protein [Zooshikella harenae]
MNTATILWGLLFGSIGLGYFIYGKKQSNIVIRLAGIALMIYPYFVDNTIALILIGAGLMLLPRFIQL